MAALTSKVNEEERWTRDQSPAKKKEAQKEEGESRITSRKKGVGGAKKLFLDDFLLHCDTFRHGGFLNKSRIGQKIWEKRSE